MKSKMKLNCSVIAIILFVAMTNEPIAIAIIFLILFQRRKSLTVLTLIVLLLCFLRLIVVNLSSVNIENQFSGSVKHINPSSMVVSTNQGAYLVICDQDFLLDDLVEVKGELLSSEDSPHFYSFDFRQYYLQEKIIGTIYASSVRLIESGDSIRHFIHSRIQRFDEVVRPVYMLLLLDEDVFDDNELIFSFGFQWSVLLYGLKCLFSLGWSEKVVYILRIVVLCILTSVLGFSLVVLRVVFFIVLETTSISNQQKCALFTILCFWIWPYHLTSLSFIIPIGLRLLQYKNYFDRFLFLVATQSFYFYEFNLVMLGFFSIYQRVIALLTLLSIVDLMFLTHIAYDGYHYIQDILRLFSSNYVVVIGKVPNFVYILLIMYLYYRPNNKKSFRYLCALVSFLYFGLFAPFAEVAMINIGQGDSFLIRLPFNQLNILIDTGTQSNYEHLKSYLMAKGIRKLDVLIISHDDKDHSENTQVLIEEFNVETLITEANGEVLFNNLNLHFIQSDKKTGDVNDDSLVTLFSLNNLQFLFLGDISKEIERELLIEHPNLQVDVVKIAHHGSSTSSDTQFLKKINGQIALISAGYNNHYNHPSPDVIKTLNSLNYAILNSQIDGDVTIYLTYFSNFIVTSNWKMIFIN